MMKAAAADPKTASPPEAPTPHVSEPPTADALLAAAEKANSAAVVQAAQAYLAPFVAPAKARIALHRRMAEEAAPILKRALAVNTARLLVLEAPPTMIGPFEARRAEVQGWTVAADTVEAALARIGTLSPRECARSEAEVRCGQQPWAVAKIRSALDMLGAGEDILRGHLSLLAEYLEPVETWAKNYAAGIHRPPVMAVSPRRDDAAPPPSVTHFNPFDHPAR